MRVTTTVLAFVLTATAAMAQGGKAAQAMKDFSSSSDVQAMIAKAKAERKQNQPTFSQRILSLAPYNANLEYRAAVGPASIHEKAAEIFYVIDGSGTLVTGGTLVKGNPSTIEGGTTRPVAKGDFFVVPENTPHWFSPINGVLVLMSLHVPRPVGGEGH